MQEKTGIQRFPFTVYKVYNNDIKIIPNVRCKPSETPTMCRIEVRKTVFCAILTKTCPKFLHCQTACSEVFGQYDENA